MSLQKFHRRTLMGGLILGSGSNTKGYYLGIAGDGISYLWVAPKSTEAVKAWGSYGTVRGITNLTDGLTNTNTLYALGSTAHPAAYYCKTLTTGGYNSWYMPALQELVTCYTNQAAVPFATANGFLQPSINGYYSSTEHNNRNAKSWKMSYTPDGGTYFGKNSNGNYFIRAVRRST